jgi:hypothetical protein
MADSSSRRVARRPAGDRPGAELVCSAATMARRKRTRDRREDRAEIRSIDPYLEMWMALSPAERLRRSWRLRRLLKNPQAIHDAKTLPEL